MLSTLTERQLEIVGYLHANNGAPNSLIGKALGMDKTAVWRDLIVLEEKGLVVRGHYQDKRRRRNVLRELTPSEWAQLTSMLGLQVLPTRLRVAISIKEVPVDTIARRLGVQRSTVEKFIRGEIYADDLTSEYINSIFGCDVCTHNYPQELLDAPRDVQVAVVNTVLKYIMSNWDKIFTAAAKKVLEKKA